MGTFANIPRFAGGSIPYVVARRADRRAFLDVLGCRVRRCGDRVDMENVVGHAYLHASMMEFADGSYIFSSVGTYYNPIYKDLAAGASSLRGIDLSMLPITTAVIGGQPITHEALGGEIRVGITPYVSPDQEIICGALVKVPGTLDTNVEFGVFLASYTVATAVSLLAEIGYIARHARLHQSTRRNEVFDDWLARVEKVVDVGTDLVDAVRIGLG